MISPRILRFFAFLLGFSFLVLAVGFLSRASWAVSLWPTAGVYAEGRFASLFVGAMLAAVGGGAVYVSWLGDMRAAAGGALALLVLYTGMAVGVTAYADTPAGTASGNHVAAFVAFAVTAAMLFVVSIRVPAIDRRPIPRLVRIAFFIFTATLVVTGTMLLLRTSRVFPWPLQPLSSVLYGCMFLGFAGNYVYAALWGTMADAKVSLFGFLVYDLVLIGPFIGHFAVVSDEFRSSLAFYTANLVFSAAVAVYCFILDWRSRPVQDRPSLAGALGPIGPDAPDH